MLANWYTVGCCNAITAVTGVHTERGLGRSRVKQFDLLNLWRVCMLVSKQSGGQPGS